MIASSIQHVADISYKSRNLVLKLNCLLHSLSDSTDTRVQVHLTP